MPISVVWDDECHTVIRIVYQDRWLWTDHYAVLTEARAMMHGVDYRVDLILDLMEAMPAATRPLWHFRQTIDMLPPNWSHNLVVVGAHRQLFHLVFHRVLGELGRTIGEWNFMSVTTLEEARTALATWHVAGNNGPETAEYSAPAS